MWTESDLFSAMGNTQNAVSHWGRSSGWRICSLLVNRADSFNYFQHDNEGVFFIPGETGLETLCVNILVTYFVHKIVIEVKTLKAKSLGILKWNHPILLPGAM